MEETANVQENATQEAEVKETKTFTQDEMNKIVSERVKKERAKYEGFDEIKDKAAKFDELQEASKSELQKAEDKATKLEKELNDMKAAESIRKAKATVSEETGIPVELLSGETEDACKEQANAIKEFVAQEIERARMNGYPIVRDAGESKPLGSHSTRDQFADWMKNLK